MQFLYKHNVIRIMKIKSSAYKENLIYLTLWLILFIAPASSMYMRVQNNSAMSMDWSEIFHVWNLYTAYLIIFLIHNFILAPLLIYKKKKVIYLATTICLITIFVIFQFSQKPKDFRKKMEKHRIEFMARDLRMHGFKVDKLPHQFDRADHGPMGMNDRPDMKERHPDLPMFLAEKDIISSMILVLLIGMNLGVKLYFKNDKDSKEMQQLEKQNLQQQLEYLKYQINPHFFMNTLNNIHALVDIDPEKAKTTIVELSKMMRYILYEGNKSLIPVAREIQFINNYITLMKLRYTDKVKISLDIQHAINDMGIPPLMLITFIENAFKHGISYQQESFINIIISFTGKRLFFTCINSKKQEENSEKQETGLPKQGGVGLANVKRRLELIYGDKYTLEIKDNIDTYNVKLDLPMT